MQSQPKPKWKQFEQFVAGIQRQLAPNAQVTRDAKIVGASGIKRQIDVAVRATVGQFQLLVVLDCKNWASPVDIKDVEGFAGLVEDVQANKGALVCNAGFTKAAKAKAVQKGIDLFSAVDVQSVEWPVYLSLPGLCDFTGIAWGRYRFRYKGPGPFAVPDGDPRYIDLLGRDGQRLDWTINLLWRAWNEGRIPRDPGVHEDVQFVQEEAFLRVGPHLRGPVGVTASYEAKRRLLFGHIPIEQARGFRDEVTGAFSTNELTTGTVDVVEVEKTWQRVEREEDLAVKPIIALRGWDHYPLLEKRPAA